MNGRILATVALITLSLICSNCRKPVGTLKIDFDFSVDEEPLVLDSCIYVNAAGNKYEISDVQFFISEVVFVGENDLNVHLASDNAHYVDVRIPKTLNWDFLGNIVCGKYNKIVFVFGIRGIQNTTGTFPNPPENNMSWPQTLGGGYHYMKINGRWEDENGIKQPFNLHLGKIKDESSPQSFADNTFVVSIPLHDFVIHENKQSVITIKMDINKWFENPNIYDFNVFGGAIMQNREAQILLRQNGKDVFTITN